MITQNIIGFRVSGLAGKSIQAYDPGAMAMLPGMFTPATTEEVNEAAIKAAAAWRVYRRIPGAHRAAFLQAIAGGIEALGDLLIDRIQKETAYPPARIITERNRTCAQLRMFADIAETGSWNEVTRDEALPDRMPAPRPDLRKMMFPLGPVVVFGASNFPLAYSTAGGDVASALAVGCPVIVKAHDSHLGTNALVAEVIMNAAMDTGMPDGVFSSLIGDGFTTGRLLVEHPEMAAVGFTGSQSGGRALYDLAQKRKVPIPVFAEMGSINPVFLLPGKVSENPAALASILAGSMSMTVGQFCTNPGLIIAMKHDATSLLLHHVVEELEKVPEAVMLNPGILRSFHSGVATVREIEGVRIVRDQDAKESNKATPVLATVPASDFLMRPQLHHEIFGPYSLVVICDSREEMKSVARHLEGQLTATVHAADGDLSDAIELMEILVEKAGRIIMNGVPTGVEVAAAMTHGGPYPASTDSRFTAVGHHALRRWIRPVTFQNIHPNVLPDILKD